MLNQPSIFSGKCSRRRHSRFGLTLIELLVVIMILGLIMIMAIPRLRMINEDRNVREAARTAGSVFAKASQRALTDGVAGVCIELNPNIFDVDNVQYAGTALYMLQKLPPYSGDDSGARALRVPPPVVPPGPANPDAFRQLEIPMPYSMNTGNFNDERNVVHINDLVSLNYNSVKYRVERLELSPNSVPPNLILRITLVLDPVLPGLPPDSGGGFPFVIHRQPKVQQSSRVQMPEGYVIDLRYSGEANNPSVVPPRLPLLVSGNLPVRSLFHDSFSPLPNPPSPPRNFETRILFAEDGFIDHYQIPRTPGFFRPNDDMYFLIARYETDPNREQVNSPNKTSPEPDPLSSPTNMWLKVDVRTGATTIAYNAPPPNSYVTTPPTPPELFLPLRINDARVIARTGQAAAD